jgi:hypothetical protein
MIQEQQLQKIYLDKGINIKKIPKAYLQKVLADSSRAKPKI